MIRVYELPQKLTNGFCVGGGNPITFLNVDWFDDPGEREVSRADIEAFIRAKRYIRAGASYLVLDDRDGETFVIRPIAKALATPSDGELEEDQGSASGSPTSRRGSLTTDRPGDAS